MCLPKLEEAVRGGVTEIRSNEINENTNERDIITTASLCVNVWISQKV